jgi:hypothetical protein
VSSKEWWAILQFDSKFGAFSAKGDSSSVIVDSLLTGRPPLALRLPRTSPHARQKDSASPTSTRSSPPRRIRQILSMPSDCSLCCRILSSSSSPPQTINCSLPATPNLRVTCSLFLPFRVALRHCHWYTFLIFYLAKVDSGVLVENLRILICRACTKARELVLRNIYCLVCGLQAAGIVGVLLILYFDYFQINMRSYPRDSEVHGCLAEQAQPIP